MNDLSRAIQRHIQYLSEKIGPRELGSAANVRAAAYIHDTLVSMGLAVERQPLDVPGWEGDGVSLRLGRISLPAWPNTWSPAAGVSGKLLPLGTLSETLSAEMEGKIVLLHGEVLGMGIGARRAVYYPEETAALVHRLESGGPAAVIVVNERAGGTECMLRDWKFPIPSVTVGAETGARLAGKAGEILRIDIDSKPVELDFGNVLARQPGDLLQRMVLMAHFDTQAGTPGAMDNASGVALMMALAEILANSTHRLSLEFQFLNGEEAGGVGDLAYLEQYGDTLADVVAAINVDGVGLANVASTLAVMGASAEFEETAHRLLEKHPGVMWSEPWYASDHSALLFRGVPALALSVGEIPGILHTALDTFDRLSAQKLAEAAALTLDLVDLLQSYTPETARSTS